MLPRQACARLSCSAEQKPATGWAYTVDAQPNQTNPAVHNVIEQKRKQIEALCQRYQVRSLDAFGSVLTDDFDLDTSDLDLVVRFDRNQQTDLVQQYFGFKDELEHLLNRPVDLVELHAMRSPRLRRIIERTKVPFYEAAA